MNQTDHPITDGIIPQSIVNAVRRILTSLVRLLLHFGVTYPQLAEWLKGIYVEVAEREMALPGKPQTDTRLSLLTGINRKDIKRLRASIDGNEVEPKSVRMGTEIVSRWISDPVYLNEAGEPQRLPLRSAGNTPSFETLVSEIYRQDLRARVVLDEWLRLGIVTLDTEQNICLNVDAFIPRAGLDEKAYFLGLNVADHLAAATANVQQDAPPFFERCVYYNKLTPESIAQLRLMAENKGMDALKAINRKAMMLKAEQGANVTAMHRVNIGLYAFHTEMGAPSDDKESA